MRSWTFHAIRYGMKSPLSSPPCACRQTAWAEAAQETSRWVLRAFSACLRAQWFDEVTLVDVATRAGVNVRTVIRRFGGKEGLLEAFVDDFSSSVAIERHAAPGDVARAVAALMAVYEKWGDSVIRNLAQEPRHPALKRLLDRGRAGHRAMTAEIYAPWLDRLDAAARERLLNALVTATDV